MGRCVVRIDRKRLHGRLAGLGESFLARQKALACLVGEVAGQPDPRRGVARIDRQHLAVRRTEPSSTCATCSVRAISGMPVSLPLNANDEVRAVTCNCGIFASRFSSSSEIPSEKYSFALPSLMSTNGSTAMLFSGMAVSDVVGLRETIMKAATIAPITSSPIATAAQRTWA